MISPHLYHPGLPNFRLTRRKTYCQTQIPGMSCNLPRELAGPCSNICGIACRLLPSSCLCYGIMGVLMFWQSAWSAPVNLLPQSMMTSLSMPWVVKNAVKTALLVFISESCASTKMATANPVIASMHVTMRVQIPFLVVAVLPGCHTSRIFTSKVSWLWMFETVVWSR